MNEREAPSPQQDDPEAPLYSTVPLEDEDGNEYIIQQQNVGRENMRSQVQSKFSDAGSKLSNNG